MKISCFVYGNKSSLTHHFNIHENSSDKKIILYVKGRYRLNYKYSALCTGNNVFNKLPNSEHKGI